jgi:hypothetical protein
VQRNCEKKINSVVCIQQACAGVVVHVQGLPAPARSSNTCITTQILLSFSVLVAQLWAHALHLKEKRMHVQILQSLHTQDAAQHMSSTMLCTKVDKCRRRSARTGPPAPAHTGTPNALQHSIDSDPGRWLPNCRHMHCMRTRRLCTYNSSSACKQRNTACGATVGV